MAVSIEQPKFKELCQSGEPCVVLVFADWCGYCNEFTPRWDDLAQHNKDKTSFYQIEENELDQNIKDMLTMTGLLSGYPTILYNNQQTEKLEKYVGSRDDETLQEMIKKATPSSTDKKKTSFAPLTSPKRKRKRIQRKKTPGIALKKKKAKPLSKTSKKKKISLKSSQKTKKRRR